MSTVMFYKYSSMTKDYPIQMSCGARHGEQYKEATTSCDIVLLVGAAVHCHWCYLLLWVIMCNLISFGRLNVCVHVAPRHGSQQTLVPSTYSTQPVIQLLGSRFVWGALSFSELEWVSTKATLILLYRFVIVTCLYSLLNIVYLFIKLISIFRYIHII